jgi:hypothetical protein
MQPKRASPLYSPLGCGAAVALVLILGLILLLRGGIPFSPGPLSAAESTGQLLAGYRSHAEIEGDCSQCHEPWSGVTSERCETCHTEVAEQRLSRSKLHGHLPVNAPCQQCHTEHKGRQAGITVFGLSDFDHETATGFSLVRHPLNYDGSALQCESCHSQNQFDPLMVNCLDCHSNADSEFISGHITFYGEECTACHDGKDSMIGFDHGLVFPLEGAHFVIECLDCHTAQVFAGTPSDCAGCHQEPEVHAGQFGLDCVRCHTTVFWAPAQLSQHTFPIDHGDQGKIDCQVCHLASYIDYTCYGCHDHEPAETREEHREEGISQNELDNCAECHPIGLKEEDDDR